MRQRTRLAQAIAHEPDFLILDEPFSGLDPIARHTMTTLLQDWIERKRSLLISSHVLHEIESLTRSFLLISGGRLLASGSTDEIGSLLSNMPSEVRLKVQSPRQLAAELLQGGLAETISIEGERDLRLTTVSAGRLSEFLGQAISEGRYLITEMRSTEDSLQDVFNSLMKLHRGLA
jgi:ABC-2 type transport system ATP-binding protein